jgi:hypothetical protein
MPLNDVLDHSLWFWSRCGSNQHVTMVSFQICHFLIIFLRSENPT